MLRSVGIAGVGSYLPPRVLTSKELAERFNTTEDWIIKRTGVHERRIVDGEAASDLGLVAAERALKRANVTPNEIQLIIVATITPDMIFPTTACVIQSKLNAKNAACVDILAACAGFIYALEFARGLIASSIYDVILVVASDVLSCITDWDDLRSCVLFGDGAAACVLKPTKQGYGLLSSILAADGEKGDILCMPAGGSRLPASHDTVNKKLHTIRMQGKEVFKEAISTMANLVERLLAQNNLEVDDVDIFIPHQANLRIIEALGERLGIDKGKIWINLDRYGNVSAASCPVALDEALLSGRIKEGNYIVMVAFGGGLVYGANLIRWGNF